jgi:hypothetical protein
MKLEPQPKDRPANGAAGRSSQARKLGGGRSGISAELEKTLGEPARCGLYSANGRRNTPRADA